MGWNDLADVDFRALLQPVVADEASGKTRHSRGLGSKGLYLGRGPGLDDDPRLLECCAEAPETAAQVTAEIYQAEVEACWRLHANAVRHEPAAVLTKSVSSAIASRSTGPAVLSTITCSRSNSDSM